MVFVLVFSLVFWGFGVQSEFLLFNFCVCVIFWGELGLKGFFVALFFLRGEGHPVES